MSESIQFLLEIRTRLLRYFLVLLGVAVPAIYFAKYIYHWLALPLIQHMQHGPGLIAIGVPAPLVIPIKAALAFSFFVTTPYLLFQLWRFIAPGLYQHERRFVWPLLATSVVLFYLGIIFAYFVVLPLVFQFFLLIAPAGIEVKPDISQYFSFTLRLFFAFGFAFELPVAIVLLVWSGLASVNALKQKRPYVIVGIFAVAMLLTPPDVISQILLAVPLWLLFEFGLLLAKRLK